MKKALDNENKRIFIRQAKYIEEKQAFIELFTLDNRTLSIELYIPDEFQKFSAKLDKIKSKKFQLFERQKNNE